MTPWLLEMGVSLIAKRLAGGQKEVRAGPPIVFDNDGAPILVSGNRISVSFVPHFYCREIAPLFPV